MPHQCTNCGLSFEDGSKEMLSGCPDCGGNKFQFHPSDDDVPEEPDTTAEPPEPPGPDSSVARTVGNAAATVRNLVGGSDAGSPEPDATSLDDASTGARTTDSSDAAPTTEDTAQANARSEVVSPDEIPSSGWGPTDDTDAVQSDAPTVSPSASDAEPAGEQQADELAEDRPDLAQLREELNDQFESIKILSPGTYELNLMELYDREEYIIALQEDGRYTIQVPETWHE
ncbi:Zn-ribbon containing protein [Halorientalis brevis]|uniref:Zn-ribbon containing protein n=1 Tax=Halorientalis brevis TaxID=1126241 RepID=A0ABD6C8C7_9EURY|nr:Zn-ribbon domain-containing protein [Halorientalis brevis]